METAAQQIRRELEELSALARHVAEDMTADVQELAELVSKTLEGGGTLFFCGNGGSAADAQHLAAEYVVRFGTDRRALPALALTTDTSVITAAGNDLGFARIFARQVEALSRPGDLLLLHSTSGESENLLLAADAAREKGVRSAALLARGGGRLAARVDLALILPTQSTPHAQELHLAIGHLVCALAEARVAGAPEKEASP